MSFSEKSKKNKRYRFNIIDVLLLMVILLSVSAMLFLFFYDGGNENKNVDKTPVELIYTVEQSELTDILRGKINIGDAVFDSKTLNNIGQVIDVEYTDSVYTGFDPETNAPFEAIYPGKIDMRVKISVKAYVDERGVYYLDDIVFSSGKNMDLRFPYYTGKCVCVSVSEVSE